MNRGSRSRLNSESWVRAARAVLIQSGVERVKIEPLAVALGVTRGSFYAHFRSRQDLLAALLEDWKVTNTRALQEAIEDNAGDGRNQLKAVVRVWIEESSYSPAYDTAMRDWARTAKAVAKTVMAVDEFRISLIKGAFEALGYRDPDSQVRANVMYFHQVGYYAMRVKQTRSVRFSLAPTYLSILSGQNFLEEVLP